MKKNVWIISALMALTASAALAQDTSSAPVAPAPAATSSETEAASQRPKATKIKSRVEINPPATAIVKGKAVNVRGQPSFIGEVLGHLQSGDTVTLLEEITLSHPPTGEPPKWYKIVMPTNIPAWVKIDYIDAATKAVKVRRVNLRGGPGENFSVVGRLEKGAMITPVRDEKGWTAIEAPTNAYAFIAAEFAEIQPTPAPVAAVAPAPTPEPVATPPPAAPVAATAAPANTEPAQAAAPVAPAPTPQAETAQELAALHQAAAPEPAAPVVVSNAAPAAAVEPIGPRIVTREGFVHKAHNIQSPADYELHDIKSGDLIEYLQPQGQQNFKIYVGTRVSVTGPEVMDTRWPRTPVLQVQSVELMP